MEAFASAKPMLIYADVNVYADAKVIKPMRMTI
jgi:hypothetical protein